MLNTVNHMKDNCPLNGIYFILSHACRVAYSHDSDKNSKVLTNDILIEITQLYCHSTIYRMHNNPIFNLNPN